MSSRIAAHHVHTHMRFAAHSSKDAHTWWITGSDPQDARASAHIRVHVRAIHTCARLRVRAWCVHTCVCAYAHTRMMHVFTYRGTIRLSGWSHVCVHP